MTTGTFEMDWLTRVILVGVGVVATVVLLLFVLALVDAFAQNLEAVRAVRAATQKPVGRWYCPLCLFAVPLGQLPTDRWTAYAFAGEARPCPRHAAQYARMAHSLWAPDGYSDEEPLLAIYVGEDVNDISELDTHELPEVKAS